MISNELMNELRNKYVDDYDSFIGKTITGAGTNCEEEFGYIIFDDNTFTILTGEEYYGSKEFKIKRLDEIKYDLASCNDYLLKELADLTDFDYEMFNNKILEAEKVKQELQTEKEKQHRYAEYLRLKQEFEK